MRGVQKQIISELGVKNNIDPLEEITTRINFLCDYARSVPGCNGFVLGVSGGQDSTLAGKLAQLAAVKLRESNKDAKFVALRLPFGKQFDEEDALKALNFITPDESYSLQIENAVDAAVAQIEAATGQRVSDFNKGNIKARQRMIMQYAVAGDRGLLVVGSDHAAEAVTGFFTKFGDGAADIMPLSGLTKDQGRQMLKVLGADPALYEKIPTADLLDGLPGESDEDALGISYETIDSYLAGKEVNEKYARNIENKFKVSRHKRMRPVWVDDDWWRE